jgi:hypothetical protein
MDWEEKEILLCQGDDDALTDCRWCFGLGWMARKVGDPLAGVQGAHTISLGRESGV